MSIDRKKGRGGFVHRAWMGWLEVLFLLGVSLSAQAQPSTYYGPPYHFGSAWGSGTAGSLNGAIALYESDVTYTCSTNVSCPNLAFRVVYLDPASNGAYPAAQVYNSAKDTQGNTIYASASSVDMAKNLGSPDGCLCKEGTGGSIGGSSPHGSSGDAAQDANTPDSLTTSEGDPISLANGNKFEQDTDFRSPDGALTFRRFYNSRSYVVSGAIGAQWRHTFDRLIEVIQYNGLNHPNLIHVYRPDGSAQTFRWNQGAWSADSDNPNQLTELDDANGLATGYVLHLASSRAVESYSASGLLQSITDANGTVTSLSYSTSSTPATIAPAPNLLLNVTAPSGRALAFAYDSHGRLSTVTEPDGGVLAYAHDSNNNLTSVSYPDGKSRQYIYNEAKWVGTGGNTQNILTGVVDEAGVRFESIGYLFGSYGIATSNTFAGGADAVQFNNVGVNPTMTTPLGQNLRFSYAISAGAYKPSSSNHFCGTQCNETDQSRAYDANGYPQTATDFNNNVTATTYDGNGLLDQQIDAQGTASQRTTNTTWNTTLRVPLTRVVQDAGGNTVSSTQWVYDAIGQTLARCEIDPTNSAASGYACSATGTVPAGVRRWTYTYCTAVDGTQCPIVGLLLSSTGPRTDLAQTTTYSYYLTASAVNCGTPGAACHQPGDLYQVTDALGHVTTYASYDADGRSTRITDANGVNTDLAYTPRGWLASRTVGGEATQFTYTAYGAVQTVTDPDGVTTTYGYDAAHRLTQITDALGNYIQYTLDAAGNKTTEQVLDGSGSVHQSLSRTFNPLGQLTAVVDGLNQTVFNASASASYDGNGNLVQSSDGLGIQRQSSYDALNRLVQTIDNYNGSDAATQNTTTHYTYDSLDRLTQVTDPSNLATTYRYDGLSDATGQVSPDTGATNRTYDAAGNVLTRTDAKGITATNTYDALDRLASTSYPDSTQNVAYHYDEANSVTGCGSSNPVGRLTRIVENAVTTVYCYDARGNVLQKQQTTAAGTDTTAYSYTAANRLSGLTYPSGTQVAYTRDADGRIQSLGLTPPGGTASTVVSSVTYQPFGPVSGYTLGNGQAIARSYDANYRLTDLTSPAFTLHMARDAMGDITAIGNAAGANPATETYRYDPLYRLTQVADAGSSTPESVTYNPTGDRLSKSGSGLATGTYSYNANTHQLTATGSYARAVDANGNTTGVTAASGNLGFGYNDRNRMAIAQVAGSTVGSYAYDALGERIGKVAGTASATYGYDEDQQLLSERGATNRDYVWMDGIPVANVDTTGATSTIAYVTADQLGTPRAISNGSGSTVWQLPYPGNAWGELPPASSGYTYNLRFPGQYFDAETGTHTNGYRPYDPATGRYLQVDPLGLWGGQWSTYAYVGGNPLTRTDPTGLKCNAQGCWNTPQERAYAQAGDWRNYYATACANGDPYACEGGNVANNRGILSGITNYRLASSIGNRLPLGKTCAADQALIDQNMEKIREALVVARAAQLDAAGASPDHPVMVSGQSISDFHNQAFQANGAGPVFGGDIPGANALLKLSNIGNGGYGWCSAPACHP